MNFKLFAAAALLGAVLAVESSNSEMTTSVVQEKGNCRPYGGHHALNRNVRPCHGVKECPEENLNRRYNPACPKPCNGRRQHPDQCWSSSSSSSECWSESSSSSHCEPCHHHHRKSSSSTEVCSSSSSTEVESCHPHHPHHHDHHHHHDHPHHHHHHDHHHHHVGPVQLEVNGGWYKFHFGKTGSTVPKTFDFVTVGPAVLRITDLDCSGDAFSVYDNGNLILQTPFIGGDNCHHADHQVGPHQAYDSTHYSHGRVNLAPGAHSIKVVVARSPNGHGHGALRVDSVLGQCPRELNGLKVVNTPVPFHKAKGVCKAIGMKLADIDIYNFLDATTIAFECAGAFSASWIGSYWKNDYKKVGLALYTGAAAPGGSINVPACAEEHLPVICQVIDEECHHHHRHSSTESSSSSSSCDCSYANHDHVCCECSSSSESSDCSSSSY